MLLREPASSLMRSISEEDPEMIVWWASETECVSAIARRERLSELSRRGADVALDRLVALKGVWAEIEPGDTVRTVAARLLRTHPVRAGDSLQLAAAVTAAEGDPASLPLVTLDGRLADAARLEGFAVLGV
jgi:uncharacterized protein